MTSNAKELQTGRPPFSRSLSARLLLLTVLFILLAEFLIWTPSISRYRKVYLEQMVADARLATLAVEARPDNMVSPEMKRQLLNHVGAIGIILSGGGRRLIALAEDMPTEVAATFDLRSDRALNYALDAFSALAQNQDRIIRVVGPAPKMPEMTVEVVMAERPMIDEMLAYSTRILQLSLVISLFTAGAVYVALLVLTVRPLQRITAAMARFRRDPEGWSAELTDVHRQDEIGVAERELLVMQEQIRAALRQRSRLAMLGEAVAKVNHDLRNSLATAVLISDKLAAVEDPDVKEVTPKLYQAIDHAVNLCAQTLHFVGESTPEPNLERFHLSELVHEMAAGLKPLSDSGPMLHVDNHIPFEQDCVADRRQLYRVLINLGRNALESGASKLTLSAEQTPERLLVRISDNGPGLPQKARDNLFKAFVGSGRRGGTGLGLVIVRDILHAHKGDIALDRSGPDGTTFILELPAPPPDAEAQDLDAIDG